MLRMFTPVAIVCDRTMYREADALRGVLESFALQVDFYNLIQKQQLLAFFSQHRNYAYTVIFCHGSGDTANESHLRIEVVDQKSGDYDAPTGWDFIAVELTPDKITEIVRNREGTLLSTACGSGRKPLAEAFLKSGYNSYIAPVSLEDSDMLEDVDLDSSLVFFINFFYYIMAGVERDYSTTTYTEQEAVDKAIELDPDFILGTKCFHRYTKEEKQ